MSGLPAAFSPGAELLLRTAGETLYDTICPLLPNTFVPVVILKLESLCDPLVRKASSAKLIKIFLFSNIRSKKLEKFEKWVSAWNFCLTGHVRPWCRRYACVKSVYGRHLVAETGREIAAVFAPCGACCRVLPDMILPACPEFKNRGIGFCILFSVTLFE